MCDGGGTPSSQVVTQQTNTAPWAPQQDYLKEGFQGAQDWFQSNQPEFFPDSTVVGFAPQTEQALRGMETRALTGSPVQQAGNQSALDTIQGNFLSAGNPYFQDAFNASMAPAVENFNRNVLPGVDSAFERAGRYGSEMHRDRLTEATDSMSRAMAEQAAKMGYGNYAQERQNMLNMTAMAPQLAAADYQDMGQLAQVGAAREGLEGARLQDQINRFNFEQNKDKDKVAQYLALVGGGYGTSGTSSTTQPLYSNPAGSFLSGALGGAGLGSLLGGGPLGAGIGALGGGLLSVF